MFFESVSYLIETTQRSKPQVGTNRHLKRLGRSLIAEVIAGVIARVIARQSLDNFDFFASAASIETFREVDWSRQNSVSYPVCALPLARS